MFLKKLIFCSLCILMVNCLAVHAVCAAGSGFTVQVETLSFEPAARAVVNRLNARGYNAYFESQAVSSKKRLYKVRFGRFATREEARAAAQAYKKHEQRDCFVVQTMLPDGPASPAVDVRSTGSSSSVGTQTPAEVSGSLQVPMRSAVVAGDVQAGEQGKEFYTVQIAAKADRSVAQELVGRLHSKGYPVYLRGPAPGDSKPFYRIRIGKYATRTQAEQAGREYAERERGDYLVVLSPVEFPKEAPIAAGTAVSPAAPKPSTLTGSFFTVQVCVRETTRAAESYADRVRAKGFDPYITTYKTSKGKTLYRVRMGKFKERSRADERARAYKNQGGRDCLVVRTEQAVVSQNGTFSVPETPVSRSDRVPLVADAMPHVAQPDTEAGGIASADKGAGAAQAGSADVRLPDRPASRNTEITKVFAYTGSGNELNLTNAYAKIPKELLEHIQYVSIFPVMLVAVPETGSALVMEVEGVQRLLALSGIRLPEDNRAVVSAGIQDVLSAESLRLKYSPADDRKELLTGTLYYRSGVDLQIELLKRGLAHVDEKNVPGDRQKVLHAAQQRAQGLKAGIWATHVPEVDKSGL
jgi:cell division septation protein DedD